VMIVAGGVWLQRAARSGGIRREPGEPGEAAPAAAPSTA